MARQSVTLDNMLVCPVRGCRRPLARQDRQVLCSERHSFDMARSGYVNLLQPQDRRSRQPGDTVAAIAGRRHLHDTGATAELFRSISDMVQVSAKDVVLDAGCGEGFYLGTLAGESGCQGIGIDISTAAVDAAARRYPGCQWVVANADRFIPVEDRSFSVVLSITARMNAGEFRRVLGPAGRLLVALPAPEDLVELRGAGRDRVPRTVETFGRDFRLLDQRRTTTTAELDEETVQGVLHSIYRPGRSQSGVAMRVTFSFDLLLFGVTG